MKRMLVIAGMVLAGFAAAGLLKAGDDVTVTGYVSDSMCGLNHSDMQAKHGGAAQFSDEACVKACVGGGAKYVIADRDSQKTYNVKDQKKLAKYAGKRVQITGDLKGDTLDIEKVVLLP